MFTISQKKVTFCKKNIIFYTYSKKEYDRSQIDSILYLKSYNKISICDWLNFQSSLYKYKKLEMIIHINNKNNTTYK